VYCSLSFLQLNITDDIKDSSFTSGMRNSAIRTLGDNQVTDPDGTVRPDWDDTFLQEIHGVALVAGDSHDSVNEALTNVKNILSNSVKEISTISGDVRPGDQKGHEQ